VAHNQQVTRLALTILHPVRIAAPTPKPSSRDSKVLGQITFVWIVPICLGPFSFARNCAIEIAGRVTILTVPRVEYRIPRPSGLGRCATSGVSRTSNRAHRPLALISASLLHARRSSTPKYRPLPRT